MHKSTSQFTLTAKTFIQVHTIDNGSLYLLLCGQSTTQNVTPAISTVRDMQITSISTGLHNSKDTLRKKNLAHLISYSTNTNLFHLHVEASLLCSGPEEIGSNDY